MNKEIELKDKIKELKERKEGIENSLFGTIFGALGLAGVSGFFFIKKPEHYFWPAWIFVGLAGLCVIMAIVSYISSKNVEKELKELKKQEKELKGSIL